MSQIRYWLNRYLSLNSTLYSRNLCTKDGWFNITSTAWRSVPIKIKAPTFASLLFIAISPQLKWERRIKFLETLNRIIPLHNLKALWALLKQGQTQPSTLSVGTHDPHLFFQFFYNLSGLVRPSVGVLLLLPSLCWFDDGLTISGWNYDPAFHHLLGKNSCDKKIFLLFK